MNYKDYIVSHKEFVGFNSDATTADRLHIERVESAHPCDRCGFEQTSNLNSHDPLMFSVINPVYCPYNVVKINGVAHKRNRIFDENLAHTVKKEERCPGCGIPVGFIHHIGCEYDVCPGCESSYCWCYYPVGYSTLNKSILNEHDGDVSDKYDVYDGPPVFEYLIENDYTGE